MRYISNHKGETLLFSRLKHLVSESETVTIVSSDNASFEVSKFVFTFFSDIFHYNHDCIIAPLSSSSLSLIVDFINLHKAVNLSKESSNYIQYVLEEAELLGLSKESLKNLVLPSSGRNETGAGRKTLVNNGNKPQLEKKNIKTDYALNKIKAEKSNELDEEEEGQISISVNKNETDNDVQSTKNSSEIIQDNLAERKNYVQEEVEHHSKKIQIGNKCKRSNKKEKISVKKEKKTKKNSKTKKKEKVTKKINVSEEKEKKLKVRGNPIQHFGTLENGKRRVESLQCRLCGEFFLRKKYRKYSTAYNNHYEKHEILLFTCDCDYKSSSYHAKRKHFKTVHQNMLGCPIKACPSYMKSESALKLHLEGHKNSCDLCNFETTRPGNLKKHIDRTHNKPVKSIESTPRNQEIYKCKDAECDKEFNNPYTLDNHMRKVHNPQPCPICGKIVKTLLPHLKTHATNEDKDFHCDQCGKGFDSKTRIEEHIQVIHNGIKFYCRYPNCKNSSGSGFSGYRDSSNRSAHERKHHGAPYTKYQESVIL